MGRRIDRAVLPLLFTAGYYLFLLNAWGSIPLSCAGAFVCAALTDGIVRRMPLKRRAGRARIRAGIERISAMDEGEAGAVIEAIIRKGWPGEAFRLAPVIKHPEATLSCGDVLNAWKANRDAERVVVAGTCPCEPRAIAYARTLHKPRVAVVDSRRLARLLQRQGADALPPLPHVSFRERLKATAARVAAYRFSPRDGVLCAALFGMYLMTGNGICLFCAMAIVGRICVALSQRRMGRRLFDM